MVSPARIGKGFRNVFGMRSQGNRRTLERSAQHTPRRGLPFPVRRVVPENQAIFERDYGVADDNSVPLGVTREIQGWAQTGELAIVPDPSGWRLKDYGSASALPRKLTQPTRLGDEIVGGKDFSILSGPVRCQTAQDLLCSGITLERAGLRTLRVSAEIFRNLTPSAQRQGLRLLERSLERFRLAVIVKIASIGELNLWRHVGSAFEVQADGLKNARLLRALGETQTTVLLHRDPTMTVEEFADCVRWVELGRSASIVIVESGICLSTGRLHFHPSVITMLQREMKYPVLVDCGRLASDWTYMETVAGAAVGAGADGIVLQFNPEPFIESLGLGGQPLPTYFLELVQRLRALRYTFNAAQHIRYGVER